MSARFPRPPVRLALLLVTIAMALPSVEAAPANRYFIAGSLTAVPAQASSDPTGMSVQAHLQGAQMVNQTSAANGFVLTASLVASPDACASDVIFEDGFESP